MRYAIFSDIHNHQVALQHVINHIKSQNIDATFCLGDVGIDSCIELVRTLDAPTVFGNWEVSHWNSLSSENREWALGLPPIIKMEDVWLTHAAPFWPDGITCLADLQANPHIRVKGNLFPYLHYEEDSLWETIAILTEATVPLLFHGHTHRQMGWRFTSTNKLLRLHKPLIQLLPNETYVIGVGSVGRPQDGPGFSYVIYDSEAQSVEFHRLQ